MKTTLDTLLKQIAPLPYSSVKGKILESAGFMIASCSPGRGRSPDESERALTVYLTHAANMLPVLVEALEANLKCLTMDSDSEEDYAPEIEQTRQALTAAREIDL